ncbi:hypothetical protein M422DRAFT_62993 [Sphaerobolus stellatus SS14]|nr:hypothetical protein M422DRAFT_62993 [Sphaerobolus stellatus SS14]
MAHHSQTYSAVFEHLDGLVNGLSAMVDTSWKSAGDSNEEKALLDALTIKINATLAKSLSAVRTRRNQLVWINQLPDELLSMIFLFVTDYCQPGLKLYQAPSIRHMELSWVCRRWRTLIQSNATFWALVDTSWKKPLIDTFFKFSKEAQLRIVSTSQRRSFIQLDTANRLVEILKSESRRIQSITIPRQYPHSPDWEELANYLESGPELPELRHLRFSRLGPFEIELYLWPGGRLDLHSFLQGLLNARPWESFTDELLSSAQILRITMSSFAVGRNYSFELPLQTCQRLRILSIEWHIPNESRVAAFSKLCPATLEHLHILSIRSGAAFVLRKLELPRLKKLWCHLDMETQDSYQLIKKHIDFSAITELTVGYSSTILFYVQGRLGPRTLTLNENCCRTGMLDAQNQGVCQAHSWDPTVQFLVTTNPTSMATGFKRLIQEIADTANALHDLALRFKCRRKDARTAWYDVNILEFFKDKDLCRLAVEDHYDPMLLFDDLADMEFLGTLTDISFSYSKINPKPKSSLGKQVFEIAKQKEDQMDMDLKLYFKGFTQVANRYVKGLKDLGIEILGSDGSLKNHMEIVTESDEEVDEEDEKDRHERMCHCPCIRCREGTHILQHCNSSPHRDCDII